MPTIVYCQQLTDQEFD